MESFESVWRYRAGEDHERGAPIDLVIDRKDACINLCDMKFSQGEFTIDKRYAAELRNKREAFRRPTGTKKALILTMVTTHGVRDNAYRRGLVDMSLEMDALFAR